MKLSDNQKVAIYASALQGALINPETNYVQGQPVEAAIYQGDKLIAAIESRNEADPHEIIPDA